MKNEYLIRWENATNELAYEFRNKYFDVEDYVDWISDEIGDVAHIGDYFFEVSDMVDFLKYKYPKKKMFEYYDYALKCYENKENPICIRDYKKLK
jgi:hypothetical protein